ncbi:hypothetical protein HYQ44_009513 [Verticillium longisporum]|nr:hypothetical protein HYQ44_009513 [Verticillium longisporum]
MASSLGVRKTARMESIFRTGFLSGLVSALLSLTATAVSRSPTASSSVVSSEGHAAHLAATWARAAASSPTDEGSALHGGGTGHTPPSGVTARAELPALAPGAAASWNRTLWLSGRCANKTACGYSHATLSEEESMVYRWLMRRQK